MYVFVAYSMILKDKRKHRFLVCNLRPVFENIKFDLRPSLEPFEDLDGRFDPPSTKRSLTVHAFLAF